MLVYAAKSSLEKRIINKTWKKRKKSKKWFDKECQELKYEASKMARKKHENPKENLLKKQYHHKLKEYKSKCKSKRYLFWQNTFKNVEESLNDPKSFWKKWRNANELEYQPKVPDITGDEWYNHFSNLHTEIPKENAETFNTLGNRHNRCSKMNEPLTKKEFMFVIKNIKNDKAAGYDSIVNEMIKNLPEVILNLLHKFINLCLQKSLIPQSWCMDIITPIFKDGSLNDPNNYRGICISSALLKIVCSALNIRIQEYCKTFDLINKNQIGFKSKHRTSDHLLTLKAIVKRYVTIGKRKLFACFIDFKKAYDSIWHEGLFHKMKENGIMGNFLNLVKDIYKKTKCAVKVKDSTTNFFNYTKGVRQGCPLSPILFNMYIDDIFETVNKNNESDISLGGGDKYNALMYADDLIILSDSEEGLQRQINKISGYCKKWKLDINIKKTKVMIFNRGNKLLKSEVRYENKILESVKVIKYLGFTLSAKNCSLAPTIDDLSIRANRAVFALNNKMKISNLPTKLALKVFQSQIMPILLYGAEVWGPYMDFDFLSWEKGKIERVQTQFIKRVLGCNIQTSNIMARGEVGMRPLLLNVIKSVVAYTENIKNRPTSTVYAAYDYESHNDVNPNFCTFIEKFDLNLQNVVNKNMLKKICQDTYDRRWWEEIINSPKATSYAKFKNNVKWESYLNQVENSKHKKSLSRFRLSNHPLLIERGRHMRPRLERCDRKCFRCSSDVEDECHFVIKCPLYIKERNCLLDACRKTCLSFDSMSEEQKFIFILSNEDIDITRVFAGFLFRSFKIRETSIP